MPVYRVFALGWVFKLRVAGGRGIQRAGWACAVLEEVGELRVFGLQRHSVSISSVNVK